MSTRRALWTCAVALTLAVPFGAATAQTPAPIDPRLFAFPGSLPNPASARSAGLALADRWLGDEPYDNPAAVVHGLTLSPLLLRVSRQDLRAENRNYDETPAFIDGAGLALGMILRGTSMALYGAQPGLRLEDNAYSRGRGTVDPLNPPATVQAHADLRELHAGLALSRPWGPTRVGLGVEWMRREESYRAQERSGNPLAGTERAEFSGNAVGMQIGVRYDRGDSGAGHWTVGLATRLVPSLDLTGSQQSTPLLAAADTTPIATTRGSAWEGGLSLGYQATPEVLVLASFGGRTSQEWSGFGVTTGTLATGSIGFEYHDAEAPWTARFGLGMEAQNDVPEPHAGIVSLGVGWNLERTRLDFGVVHRTLARPDEPPSSDDRVVASVSMPW